ncbi:hypothetical protein GCM10009860_09620 [Microbacterium mitrae]|nr:glycosyltransferase [Microbacterium mitrae]
MANGVPNVSIIVPLFNDAQWVGQAIESCLAQTSQDFEVICVDDASTDATAAIVQRFTEKSPRVRLIEQGVNQSAFQARKVGIAAASGEYVLFLDGDDELAPTAVETSFSAATLNDADIVGFGIDVLTDGQKVTPRFERSLQPPRAPLHGEAILSTIMEPEKPAQGHLWRYLWRTDLLRAAYAETPPDAQFWRANDLPITFLGLAAANKYVGIGDRLYRYNFRRGTSGQLVSGMDKVAFFLSAIDSLDSISEAVKLRASLPGGTSTVEVVYDSARRSIVGNILRTIRESTVPDLREPSLDLLRARVADDIQLLKACASFYPRMLSSVSTLLSADPLEARHVQNVLITTGNLRAGGVQGVVVAQARLLAKAGYRVTLAVFDNAKSVYALPDEVEIIHVHGDDVERISHWAELIRERAIDMVVDHHILYNRRWPYLVLTARALGVPTIGWLHNFALRPVADMNDGTSFLLQNLPLLFQTVVLSNTDVAFWKSQGVANVTYLPNPASLVDLRAAGEPKTLEGERIEIAWWGRLQQSTKQVRDLIEIAAELQALSVDFHMRIIGPDSADISADDLRALARKHGVRNSVTLVGPCQGDALEREIARAHVFISTSVIEGYPLTLVEAQAHGLPVVMYELPWLAAAVGNHGIVSVPQGDKRQVASAIARMASDPQAYSALSGESLAAAERALGHDFTDLYRKLFANELPAQYSPEPTTEDLALIVRLAVAFSERNARAMQRHEARTARQMKEHSVAAKELSKANREARAARRRADAITSGASFRIGRAITFLPRVVHRALRR